MRYPHPCYADTLPFASVRQRLIGMLNCDPPLLDADDLCKDLVRGGLICWGSSISGDARKGSGAPWDCRSWEAQPWFLKKWWLMVGGSDGVIFKQTRWWHEFRGDRLPDIW
jgi:hypothetical protein